MKTRQNAAALVLIISVFSCTDLHKDPVGLLTPGQVSTDPTLNSVKLLVSGTYQMLANTLNQLNQWQWDLGTVFRDDFVLQDLASDDMKKKWSPDGDQAWMDQVQSFNFTSSNPGFNGQWTYDYEGITRANLAWSYLTDDALAAKIGIDPVLRNRLLGETYFLRAFYYFDLVNNFGAVPLLVKPLQSFNEVYTLAKREPRATIYAQISADLAKAKPLLPNSKYSDNIERWRVSKGAVLAMQAKVALYNDRWAEVITTVSELEGLGFYSLNPNYFDAFAVAKEYTENEDIFFFDHQPLQDPRKGNGLCAPLDWGFIAPTDNFLAEFEPNDPRRDYTVNVAAKDVYKLLGTTNTAVDKYKGNDESPGNKIYIRMADVLLWKAEAYNETGGFAQAIAIINQIRARARTGLTIAGTVPPAGTLLDRPASVDKALIKSWLIHERRVELGFESQRFNDLKRWKIAAQVLTPAIGKNFSAFNYLYPIPQREIDRLNGHLDQNLGY